MASFYFVMFPPFFCFRVLLFYSVQCSYNISGLAVSALFWHFLLAIRRFCVYVLKGNKNKPKTVHLQHLGGSLLNMLLYLGMYIFVSLYRPLCGQKNDRYSLTTTSSSLATHILDDSSGWQNKFISYCHKLFLSQTSIQRLVWTSKRPEYSLEVSPIELLAMLFWDLCFCWIRCTNHQTHLR